MYLECGVHMSCPLPSLKYLVTCPEQSSAWASDLNFLLLSFLAPKARARVL